MYIERTDLMLELFPEPPVLEGEGLCLSPLQAKDVPGLRQLTRQEEVYRYLPTFLFERKYPDAEDVIDRMLTRLEPPERFEAQAVEWVCV